MLHAAYDSGNRVAVGIRESQDVATGLPHAMIARCIGTPFRYAEHPNLRLALEDRQAVVITAVVDEDQLERLPGVVLGEERRDHPLEVLPLGAAGFPFSAKKCERCPLIRAGRLC